MECVRCGTEEPAGPIHERVRAGERPPTCACGGTYKPAVVLFGESLPPDPYRRARQLAEQSDVFLAIGSSLRIDPAASLPSLVSDGTVAVINFEPTRYAESADHTVRADVTDVLPALATRVLDFG